ncbi:MAG: PTS sugar transporter subunit IIC [Mediterraneibacter gnavus]
MQLGWLTTGIGIAAGILPALGFAQLINMIMNQEGCGILPVRILVKRISWCVYGRYCMLLSCNSGILLIVQGFCAGSETSSTGRNG